LTGHSATCTLFRMPSSAPTLRNPTLAVFGVIVVSVVGGSVIALPVAMARLGAIPAGLVMIIMGAINLVAVSALASSAVRSASVIGGRGRFSYMVSSHLGPVSGRIAGLASSTLWFGIMVVYLLGFGSTLSEVFGGNAAWWTLGLGIVLIAIVTANARRLFVAAASSIATINVVLLLILIAMCLAHFRWDLFSHFGPPDDFVDNRSVLSTLDLVFGTALFVFAGFTALFSVGSEVLRADPTGKSLVRGCQYGMVAAIIVNAGWVTAVLSAVPGKAFLEPGSIGVGAISDVIGGPFKWMATAVVVLGFGLGSINAGFAAADVVTERLPEITKLEAVLRPGVTLEAEVPMLGVLLVITAVETDGRLVLMARARHATRSERQFISGDHWNAGPFLREFGSLPAARWLTLDVLGENAAGIYVRVETSMVVEHRPSVSAVWWNDRLGGLDLRIVQEVARMPSIERELSLRLSVPQDDIDAAVASLLTTNALRRDSEGNLRAVLGRRHRARSLLVQNLYSELTGAPAWTQADSANWLRSRWVQLGAKALTAILAVGLAQGLIASGTSFGRVVGLVAMATLVLLDSIVPLLLGLSSRRQAERPKRFGRFKMPTWVVVLLVVFFMAVCVLYAVAIYEAILERAVSVLAMVMSISCVLSARRFGAFKKRSTITLEVQPDGAASAFALVAGREVDAHVSSTTLDGHESISVTVKEPLLSPVLVSAVSGDVTPARLADWQVTAPDATGVERSIAHGQQMDVTGAIAELPAENTPNVTVRWVIV
ncbi:MAG: hypothetical protein RI900_2431, partial [Actinomycetota bacterium]